MASNVGEFDLNKLTNEEKQTELYKWLTEKRPPPDDMTSEQLKNIYDEQATYYDDLFWQKMGWTGWKEGAEIIARHLEERGFKKDIHILDAGAGTGLVGMSMKPKELTIHISRPHLDKVSVLQRKYITCL